MKVIVAYSGGLDTSVIVKWVKDVYNAEVIGFCADVGQEEELSGVEEKAIATGATKCYVEDLTEEFARDFIFPMMQANAIYEGNYSLEPNIKVIAPWREWNFTGRMDLVEYAKKNGIPVSTTAKKPYSMDRNLLHISFEGGILKDPWNEFPDEIAVMTKPLSEAADTPEDVIISFEKGIPVAVNGEKLSPANLMRKLNAIGKKHAVGPVDIV